MCAYNSLLQVENDVEKAISILKKALENDTVRIHFPIDFMEPFEFVSYHIFLSGFHTSLSATYQYGDGALPYG